MKDHHNMDTNLYWVLRGSYKEKKKTLKKMPRKYLEAIIIDSRYNDFLASRADAKEEEKILNNKRVPYMGWYWRHLSFHQGYLPLGFDDGYVGFMACNKWYYDGRNTTDEEFSIIMGYIDAAMAKNEEGGEITEIQKRVKAELDKLRNYMQNLKM